MKLNKLLFSFLLFVIPAIVQAQYSGNVGERIYLDAPATDNSAYPDFYSADWKVISGASLVTLTQFNGGMSAQLAIFGKGTATVTCRAKYYNRNNISAYYRYVNKTYTITCYDPNSGSNPGSNPGSDPGSNPGSNTTVGNDVVYTVNTIDGVSIKLVKYAGNTWFDGLPFLWVSGYYKNTPCVGKNTSGVVTIPDSYDGYNVRVIGLDAFSNCSNITKIVIPNSVGTISNGAIYNCSVSEIVFGNSVKIIDQYSIWECPNLKIVDLPSSVESIYTNAFAECYGIESITLSENLKSLGKYAFYSSKIKIIVNPAKEPLKLNDDPFLSGSVYDKAILYVPVGSKAKYEKAAYWKNFKTIVEGDPTGISDVVISSDETSAANAKNGVFSISGQRLSAPKKGLNIINGKKVIVK